MKVTYRSIERDLAWYLKKGEYYAGLDRRVFDKWIHKQTTIGKAIEEFKWNNNMPEDLNIPEDDFIRWLNSLGWRRHET